MPVEKTGEIERVVKTGTECRFGNTGALIAQQVGSAPDTFIGAAILRMEAMIESSEKHCFVLVKY